MSGARVKKKIYGALFAVVILILGGIIFFSNRHEKIPNPQIDMTPAASTSSIKSVAVEKKYGYIVSDGLVYYNGKPITTADAKTFTIFNDRWAKDINFVFEDGRADTSSNHYDATTFVAYPSADGINTMYIKDKNGVISLIYSTWAGLSGYEKVEGADPQTFEYLGGVYAKDKKTVYYYILPIEEADVDTFTLVSTEPDTEDYTKDKNHVYMRARIIPDADPATFVALGNMYGMDDKNVYEFWDFIPNADRNSFELIKPVMWGYAKDKNRVYIDGGPIKGADPMTFAPLSESYSKDKNHVYYALTEVVGADPTTFEILDNDLAKDKDNQFFNGEIYHQKIQPTTPSTSLKTYQNSKLGFEIGYPATWSVVEEDRFGYSYVGFRNPDWDKPPKIKGYSLTITVTKNIKWEDAMARSGFTSWSGMLSANRETTYYYYFDGLGPTSTAQEIFTNDLMGLTAPMTTKLFSSEDNSAIHGDGLRAILYSSSTAVDVYWNEEDAQLFDKVIRSLKLL